MNDNIVFCVLNAKYIHASPAAWCLAAGVKKYASDLYERIHIIDSTINQSPDIILEKILAAEPAIVSFSCYIWNINMTLDLCLSLKRILPNIIIALGGPEVSYCAKKVLHNNPHIDYILSGEGEVSVPAFLNEIFKDGKAKMISYDTIKKMDGLCARIDDNLIYESSPCVLDIDVPSPISVGYAEAAMGRITYIETSRGCPYSCAFCLSGRCGKPRYFTLDSVFKDLLHLSNSGTQTIKFVDRTFNANPLHANKILQFILDNYGSEIPEGICFHFEIAGDILREDTLDLLSQMPSGTVQLEIGMQSFCEKTLESIKRKTNTVVLKRNILKLLQMKNIHIHIDLIAGLPYEDMKLLENSFNTAYELSAHMLQLGFLKLLHGSQMRSEPENYPCEFDENAPYEVRRTPWMSENDFAKIHSMEDTLDRVYNSGRFHLTAKYIMNATNQTPFLFYMKLGEAANRKGSMQGISLDDYTAFIYEYGLSLDGVKRELLRDNLVRDSLSTTARGSLPPCLYVKDDRLGIILKQIALDSKTAPKKCIKRGAGILYAANAVCYVDYEVKNKNPVTGKYILREISIDTLVKNNKLNLDRQ